MGDDWDAFGNGRDDDGFPPAPEDVFGKNVEDVDVWQDSFGGAQEWFDFNNDSFDGQNNFDGIEEGDEGSGSEYSDHQPDRVKVRRDRSGDRSRDRTRDGSHERSRDNSRGSSGSHDRSRDRSRDRSGDGHRGKSSSRSKSRDRSGSGHSRGEGQLEKRGRRPKPLKNDPTRTRRSSSHDDDPFKSTVDNDGFPTGGQDNDYSDGEDDREHSRRKNRSSNPRRSGSSSSSTGHHNSSSRRHGGVRSRTDDNLSSSYTSSRRLSANDKTLVRRRDGTVSRARPSEHGARTSNSDARRDAVRGSLFGAIGEDEEPQNNAMSLGAFLNHDDQPPRKSNEERSVKSAPAVVRNDPRRGHHGRHDNHHRRSDRDRDGHRRSGGDRDRHERHHDNHSPTGRGKSRRYKDKMSRSSGDRHSPRKESSSSREGGGGGVQEAIKEGLKLDIAQLAEAGYIEVQDGKMRLVIDMET